MAPQTKDIKKPLAGRGFLVGVELLETLYVYRVDSFFAFLRIESYSVMLLNLQAVQASYVHEEILIRFVFGDEAEAFWLNKELYFSCLHKNENK